MDCTKTPTAHQQGNFSIKHSIDDDDVDGIKTVPMCMENSLPHPFKGKTRSSETIFLIDPKAVDAICIMVRLFSLAGTSSFDLQLEMGRFVLAIPREALETK